MAKVYEFLSQETIQPTAKLRLIVSQETVTEVKTERFTLESKERELENAKRKATYFQDKVNLIEKEIAKVKIDLNII